MILKKTVDQGIFGNIILDFVSDIEKNVQLL